ncbi:MAG: phosphate acetyltransferase [Ignavibacteria bacterium]|nr:phosphate acetyltransferase [Ignavibacteria bacterium]
MKKIKTIILPESYDDRVQEAARKIIKKKIAKVIFIKTDNKIKSIDSENLDIIDVGFSEQFLNEYLSIRRNKFPSLTGSDALKELSDPLTFSCMLLRNNYADAVVAGSIYSTSEVIRNALRVIGLSKANKTVSSFFLFRFPQRHFLSERIFAYADCGVIPEPNVEQLSDIAIQTAENFRKLTGMKPKVAFLSFSTKGSAKDKSLEKIISAYELTRKRSPSLICDGELQFDAAFVPEVARRKNPQGKIKGDANVFIFPDLNSGNIAYKITERIGGAMATGPILQGLAKPVMDLSRGCSSDDIVRMAEVAVRF